MKFKLFLPFSLDLLYCRIKKEELPLLSLSNRQRLVVFQHHSSQLYTPGTVCTSMLLTFTSSPSPPPTHLLAVKYIYNTRQLDRRLPKGCFALHKQLGKFNFTQTVVCVHLVSFPLKVTQKLTSYFSPSTA